MERLCAVCDVVRQQLAQGRAVGGPKPDLMGIEERLWVAVKEVTNVKA